jgi:hypothetical protein
VPVDVLWHMGDLHPAETWLVLLVAFGPFVVVALLVRRERRREAGVGEQPAAGEAATGEDQRSP